jgi:hypothetical protein
MIANGKQRREFLKYQGVLKNKRKQSFKNWLTEVRSNIEAGKEMHNEHLEKTDKSIEDQLQSKEEAQIKFWKELKYNDSEISKLRKANSLLAIKDKETLREDRKEARRIFKEVKQTRNNRING